MKVAVMQPYFFPYIGYFQLMHAVDCFVIFDDVQYIERGWVNRNLVRLDSRAMWLTLPVRKAARHLRINERTYALDDQTRGDILRRIYACYSRSSNHAEMSALVATIMGSPESNVARFNGHLLKVIANVLGIDCTIVYASETADCGSLRGVERILKLCRVLGATHYVNAIGGTALYDEAAFSMRGITLRFLSSQIEPINLRDGPQHLSIIDTLMTRPISTIRSMLSQHELVRSSNGVGLSG